MKQYKIPKIRLAYPVTMQDPKVVPVPADTLWPREDTQLIFTRHFALPSQLGDDTVGSNHRHEVIEMTQQGAKRTAIVGQRQQHTLDSSSSLPKHREEHGGGALVPILQPSPPGPIGKSTTGPTTISLVTQETTVPHPIEVVDLTTTQASSTSGATPAGKQHQKQQHQQQSGASTAADVFGASLKRKRSSTVSTNSSQQQQQQQPVAMKSVTATKKGAKATAVATSNVLLNACMKKKRSEGPAKQQAAQHQQRYEVIDVDAEDEE